MKTMMQIWNEKQIERVKGKMETKFQIAGVTFEGRQELLEKLNQEYHEIGVRRFVSFVPEPDNKYDSNAVRIDVDMDGVKKQLGYVPKVINKDIGELIKNDRIKWAKLADVGRVAEKGVLGGTVMYEIQK